MAALEREMIWTRGHTRTPALGGHTGVLETLECEISFIPSLSHRKPDFIGVVHDWICKHGL